MGYKLVWNKKAQVIAAPAPAAIIDKKPVLNTQALKEIFTSDVMKRLLGGGAVGAAIGGGSLGLANLYKKHDETDEDRSKRIRDAAVIGSLLGGGAGAALNTWRPIQTGPVASPGTPGMASTIDQAINKATSAISLPTAVGIGAGAYQLHKNYPSRENIIRNLTDYRSELVKQLKTISNNQKQPIDTKAYDEIIIALNTAKKTNNARDINKAINQLKNYNKALQAQPISPEIKRLTEVLKELHTTRSSAAVPKAMLNFPGKSKALGLILTPLLSYMGTKYIGNKINPFLSSNNQGAPFNV